MRNELAVRYFSNEDLVCLIEDHQWRTISYPVFEPEVEYRLVHKNHLDKFLRHLNEDVEYTLGKSTSLVSEDWESGDAVIVEKPVPKNGEWWLVSHDSHGETVLMYSDEQWHGLCVTCYETVTPIERMYRESEVNK